MEKNTVSCRHCGHEIAKGVNKCPHCGGKQGAKWGCMAVVVVFCMLLLAFCGAMSGSSSASSSSLSEDDFKAKCVELSFEDILRNPSEYEDAYCKISGEIDQIIEEGNTFSIFVYDDDLNKWGCVYKYKDDEPRLIEGDMVTFYGVCQGTANVETIFGKQVTMPLIMVEYIY